METVAELETQEVDNGIDVPGPEVFTACTSCGHRSCMYFYFMGDLMPFCMHHGEKSFEKLTDLDAPLVADYRKHLTKEQRA